MRAEIVSVGTELLLGQIVDTNAAFLGQELAPIGVFVYRRTTVGDNHQRLAAALRCAIIENDVVITIGGLGPTMDDITRDVLAEVMGDSLVLDSTIEHRLKEFFRSRNLTFLDSNLRQAYVPTHGRAIDNPNGTAPGLIFQKEGKIAIALPGPPHEFKPMVVNHVLPFLRQASGSTTVLRSRTLRIAGMGESMVEDRVKDLMLLGNPSVAPYAKTGEVHLRVSATAQTPEQADSLIDGRIAQLMERLGDHIYGYDDEPIENSVIRLFQKHGLTISTAESCTGGLLSARLTNVPGSSAVFIGGAVTYTNESKTALVSVPAQLISLHGAVSREVAESMASGVRTRFGTDFGVGITGIAGPDGGSKDKPVGLVHIAVAGPNGIHWDQNEYLGDRSHVRQRAAQTALTMLRNAAQNR